MLTHEEILQLYNNCPQAKLMENEMNNIKIDLDEIKDNIRDIKGLLERVIEDDNKRDSKIARLEIIVKIQWWIIGIIIFGGSILAIIRYIFK